MQLEGSRVHARPTALAPEVREARPAALAPRLPAEPVIGARAEPAPPRLARADLDRVARADAPRPQGVTAGNLARADETQRRARVATAGPAAPAGDGTSPLAPALNQGYQYLIGADFADAARALRGAGTRGVAVMDPGGATPEALRRLHGQGVSPIAYNNAFQTQPGERLPPGVRTIGRDGQWGEAVPDFASRAWQDRRIGEAVDAAKKGFDGVMLDNVPRAGTSEVAARYVQRMVEEARTASGNPNFSAILQNGEKLLAAHPWLAERGYVGALQREDVSYRVRGAGTGTGAPVSEDERRALAGTLDRVRERVPNLPLIAVDYPRDAEQVARARRQAEALGFNVSHLATGDGSLSRLSADTRVVRPAAVP